MELPDNPLPSPTQRNEPEPISKKTYITSLPGLAAALRDAGRSSIILPPDTIFQTRKLVPMYRIHKGKPAQEVENSVQVIDHILARLRRLSMAYGEWQHFDSGAYFDLSEEQADKLVRVTERVNTVQVIFFTDLLLPSFREAGRLWEERFLPAYANSRQMIADGRNRLDIAGRFYREIQPTMIGMWQQTYAVIADTRAKLAEDMGYLAANGAQEERYRWRSFWRNRAGPGVDKDLLPDWSRIPTLTLALEFPLPIHKQSGRMRRLKRNRERRRNLRR